MKSKEVSPDKLLDKILLVLDQQVTFLADKSKKEKLTDVECERLHLLSATVVSIITKGKALKPKRPYKSGERISDEELTGYARVK